VVDGLDEKRFRSFDLIVLGHSILITDKEAIVAAIHSYCDTPILSIRRHGYPLIAEAAYSVDSADGPEALLREVGKALGKSERRKVNRAKKKSKGRSEA
jgi:hypothetical protein